MINKSVKYLGLTLKNPIIVSSSGLTSNIDNIKRLEKAQAAAVVLKSLFEEQIQSEIEHTLNTENVPDMDGFISMYIKNNSIENYIKLISDAKQECSIPIIASICCNRDGEWVEFAKDIEKAGADALELNIFYMPSDVQSTAKQIEDEILKTAQHVVESISIPVSVKLPAHITNPLNLINELYYRGVKGVVLFNKFYEPDIDIEKMEIVSSNVYSVPQDIKNSIRWIGIASSKVKTLSYASSCGVHHPDDVIKMLLAGANAVQICSVVYKEGMGVIESMLNRIDKWTEARTFEKLSDMIGILNQSNGVYSEIFERAQFMKYYSSHKG